MPIRRALIPLILVATSTLAACGGDDDSDTVTEVRATETQDASAPPTAAPAGDSACGLLSTDDVAAAVGSPVKEGIASSGPSVTGGTFDTCIWQSDDPDHPADTATVTIYPNAAAADSAREDDSQDVAGIGDEAFTVSFAGVWAYAGEQSFFAQWYTFSGTDEDNLPKSEALAKAVATQL